MIRKAIIVVLLIATTVTFYAGYVGVGPGSKWVLWASWPEFPYEVSGKYVTFAASDTTTEVVIRTGGWKLGVVWKRRYDDLAIPVPTSFEPSGWNWDLPFIRCHRSWDWLVADEPNSSGLSPGELFSILVSAWIPVVAFGTYPAIAFIRGPFRRYRRRDHGTMTVGQRRLKVIGLFLCPVMVALWVFTVFFESHYVLPSGQWTISLGHGWIRFGEYVPSPPGLHGPHYTFWIEAWSTTRRSWTGFASTWLGFGLPGYQLPSGWMYVPVWPFVAAVGFPTAILWWRDRRSKAGFCKVCKYDLTGNVSGTCPECGARIDTSQHAGKPPRGGV